MNIWLPTPSSGPANTTRYVMPSSGMRTSSAFDAFRYCRVSTVFAERSFVINTCASTSAGRRSHPSSKSKQSPSCWNFGMFWFCFFDAIRLFGEREQMTSAWLEEKKIEFYSEKWADASWWYSGICKLIMVDGSSCICKLFSWTMNREFYSNWPLMLLNIDFGIKCQSNKRANVNSTLKNVEIRAHWKWIFAI